MLKPLVCLLVPLLLACGEPVPVLQGANVLLIVVDALRADHLGSYGYERRTSPSLDARARSGVLFEDVTSTSSQTVPAMISLLTALYPHRHGNHFFPLTISFREPRAGALPAIPDSITTLAGALQQAGYRTGAVVTNPFLDAGFGFARGFEVYNNLVGDGRTDPIGAREVNQEVLRLLRSWRDERLFLYVHYMDVHHPYQVAPRHRQEFVSDRGRYMYINGPLPGIAPEDVEFTRRLYDGAIRSLDDQVELLLQVLRRRGLDGRTLVVFTADHGDEFNEHGGMGHGWTLFQEVVAVPLLLLHPDLEPHARRISAPVSLVDVLPTILDLVGLPVPGDVDGRSLVPLFTGAAPPGDRVLFAELGDLRAGRRGPYKRIEGERRPDIGWTFDLSLDPREQRRQDSHPEAEALRESLASLPAPTVTGAEAGAAIPTPENREMRRQLEVLGYLEPGADAEPGTP